MDDFGRRTSGFGPQTFEAQTPDADIRPQSQGPESEV